MNGLQRMVQSAKLKTKQSRSPSDIAIDVEDLVMKEYGWIPLEELKATPIPRMLDLVDRIQARYERERKEMEKNKPRGKK